MQPWRSCSCKLAHHCLEAVVLTAICHFKRSLKGQRIWNIERSALVDRNKCCRTVRSKNVDPRAVSRPRIQ
eukprot:SAG31_NODE_17153_length_681_cov_1.240550_1_plen_70_part_10